MVLPLTTNLSFLPDKGASNSSEEEDDDFDHTVSSENWSRVLEALRNRNQEDLKSCLQELDDVIQEQGLVDA